MWFGYPWKTLRIQEVRANDGLSVIVIGMEKFTEDKQWIMKGAIDLLKLLNYDVNGDVHEQFVQRIASKYGEVLTYKEKKGRRGKKGRPKK